MSPLLSITSTVNISKVVKIIVIMNKDVTSKVIISIVIVSIKTEVKSETMKMKEGATSFLQLDVLSTGINISQGKGA
jgi:hypothetical protein